MAAPKEKLHLRERHTFTKDRQQFLPKSVSRPVTFQTDFSALESHQHLRAMHLQLRWQELKERERAAKQHNRQLLQQFEEAQNTLREMLTLNAAMKTIRMEYEKYLEESTPRWQQQLKEKTQAAQRKRMEEYLRSCLKRTEQTTQTSSHQPLLSQGPPINDDYRQNSLYNQDGSSGLPYIQSSWLIHPQARTTGFPSRAPHQPQGFSHVPPSFHPHPHLHHLTAIPGHHYPPPGQNPPDWDSLQRNYPLSWTSGAAGISSVPEPLWDQVYTAEPPPERGVAQIVGEEAETGRAQSSNRERDGGSRSIHLSQELDIKPVRLSSSHAESSESSRESSQESRERRKRREKRGSHRSSSDRRSSQESSRTSSDIVAVAQSSESDASSEKGRNSRRTRRSGGLAVGSLRAEKLVKERTRNASGSPEGESQSTDEELRCPNEEGRSEKTGDRSPDDKSESCREELGPQREEESGSVRIKIENGGKDEIEKESSSSEESSAGEKEEEEQEDLKDGEDEEEAEEMENSPRDEEQEERDVEEDDEASEKKNTTEEEEEETGGEDEMEENADQEEESDRLKNGQQGSASSQDEEVNEEESEGGEDKIEEDEESDEEEEEGKEEGRDEADEERDSDDSIISPQNKSKKMQVIPEEAGEDDDEDEKDSETGSSDQDSDELSDDDDVEHLLAPQQQSQQKEEKDPKVLEKVKDNCDKVEIFQVEQDSSAKTDHPSDSDEFDHFYD